MTKYCLFIVCFYLFVCLFVWLIDWLVACSAVEGESQPRQIQKTLTFKMRPSAQPFLWKWVLFAWESNILFISKVEHLTSFWYRGPGELGNGPFLCECNSFMHVNPKGPLSKSFAWKAAVFTFKIEVSKLILQITQNKVSIASLSKKVPQCQVVYLNALTVGCISPLMPFPIPNIIFL